MNKMLIIGIIALVLIGGGVYMAQSRQSAPPADVAMEEKSDEPAVMEQKAEDTASVAAGESMVVDENGIKVFTVSGSNFKFEPSTMSVKKGDKVKVIFKNTDGFHDWVIDDLGVKTQQIKSPAEETVEFTADKAGSFEYYCSVGKHKDMGMVGTLTVTE